MISVQHSVPNIYYDSSRDFQLIGHLFDLVLNATKTDADLLFNLPFSTNSDDQLLDLMAYTLGLRLSKEKYTSAQLRSICSIAFKMMRAKGSLEAVNLLCTALIRADSVTGSFEADFSHDNTELVVYITNLATCKEILREILPYIVPAGITFNIKEMSVHEVKSVTETAVSSNNVHYGIATYTNELTPAESIELPRYKLDGDADKYTPSYKGDLANLIISAENLIISAEEDN